MTDEGNGALPLSARYARKYIERYGVALVRIEPGRKFPLHDRWNEPGGYFTDPAEAEDFYARHPNWSMGAVLGPSRLCSLDVDDVECTRLVLAEVGIDLDALAVAYPTVVGNPARFRVLFRAPEGIELTRHALSWPKQEEPGKRLTVLELRGGDVQDVLPPSIHPGTGQPYTWRTPPGEVIPELPAELLSIWQHWDMFKRDAERMCPWAPQEERKSSPRPSARPAAEASVIAAFNQAHDVESLMAAHGYKKRGRRWLAPSSSTGLPGISIKDGRMFSHHASDLLCNDHWNDAFDVFRLLDHGGDFRSAVKAAAQLLGMDRPLPVSAPPDSQAHPDSPDPSAAASAPAPWTLEALLKRFALVYGDTKVFDMHRQEAFKSRAFTDLVGAELAKQWKEHAERKVITPEDVARLVADRGARGESRDMIERYVLLYGTTTVWDCQLKMVLTKGALELALADRYDMWECHPQRRIIPRENLVFDPTLRVSPETHINTFTGLPMKPAATSDAAQPFRDLLFWLVNGDAEIYWWIAKWLAYPLQHVGAKMQTALLVHGRNQGAGKSLLFCDIHRQLYGSEYGAVVGQHQLDGQYNDWRERKLFCVFEEIFSNDTKYSNMGIVKHMITGKTQRIERKFVSGWEESNHMNAVFLSNETQPLPIEPNDRRLLVVWPEQKLADDIKERVKAVLDAGGVEAWYRWLLSLDLGDFNEYTEPIITEAKQRLIEYGLPSWEGFYREWKGGRLAVPYATCLSNQLYEAYKAWCTEHGEHALSNRKFCSNVASLERRRQDVDYVRGHGSAKGVIFQVGLPPTDKPQQVWLGECIDAFEAKLRQPGKQYKEAS